MSNHSFNPFIAKKYGIIEAIIIDSFVFWTRTNAAKPEELNNFFEDRYWCFGTPEYFSKFFPYLSPRQIKYALQNLTKSKILLKNNFNKKGYDKTNWYSLSDEILSELNLDKTCLQPAPVLIEQICPIHRTNLSNALNKFVLPIPDTKPDTKPDKKLTNCESSSSEVIFSETIDKSILEEKLSRDERTNEQFMNHVVHHVDNNSAKKYKRIVRAQSALRMLKKLKEQNIIFESSGFESKKEIKSRVENENEEEKNIRLWNLREQERRKIFPDEYNEDGTRKVKNKKA